MGGALHFEFVTLFPEMIGSWATHGVVGRAVGDGLIDVGVTNPREFARDTHRTVDDRPYGGGAGMVMQVGPLRRALAAARGKAPAGSRVVYLSPQGQVLTQGLVAELAQATGLVLLCGRYEGIDERIVETDVDQEVSIGDYVLSGGELPAMVLADSVARLLPGVLGASESARHDSFATGWLEGPHYTRPEEVDGQCVPEVLLSGDHAAIGRWRLKQALGRTWRRRPELLAEIELTGEQRELLDEYIAEAGQAKAGRN